MKMNKDVLIGAIVSVGLAAGGALVGYAVGLVTGGMIMMTPKD